MSKRILYIFSLLFITIGIKSQINNDSHRHTEYADMILDIPEGWEHRLFPVKGEESFGFYATNREPLVVLFAISTTKESVDEILADVLAEHSRTEMKLRNLDISKDAKNSTLNGMTSREYTLSGIDGGKVSLGKLILLGQGDRQHILFYYGTQSMIESTEFGEVIASFKIDPTWSIDDSLDGEDVAESGEYIGFGKTQDGFLIYDEEDVTFEFPSRWEIKENSYSPKSKAHAFACEEPDSLTFFLMMSQQELMQEEYINNLPEHETNSTLKYLNDKPIIGALAGMETKEYEFEIPSLSDLEPLKGRILFFNNQLHYFYIVYGEKGRYKENVDFVRLFKTFKVN